jgi:uncharacterized protein
VKQILFGVALLVIGVGIGIGLPRLLAHLPDLTNSEILSPLVQKIQPSPLPLAKYEITNLTNLVPEPTQPIKILRPLASTEKFESYVFSYVTQDASISGQLNLPKNLQDDTPVIIMLRGYVPLEIFETGVGTRNAAAQLAEAGYVTIAPDFLGYGESSPDLSDSWEGRFIKPVNVLDLHQTIKKYGIPSPEGGLYIPGPQGIWAHSNGGQIALAVLEALEEPLPTSLWAPVTAPFPYSILFFTDELADEGKESRAWLAMFEEDYDVFDFSITQHLERVTGPIQIQHGTEDEAALYVWSIEFADKVKAVNQRRQTELKALATASATTATASATPLPPIDLKLITLPGADHNLQPSWNTAVQNDLIFFNTWLTK